MVDVCGVVEHAEGNVAGASGDVEDGPGLVSRRGARVQGAHEVIFPDAVDAEGHQVVHRVVGRGDR